jgi:hypothetical protein
MEYELTPRESKLLDTMRSSQRSREELLALAEESRRNGRDDFEAGILEILDERFPDFNVGIANASDYSRSTTASFASMTRHFDSAKAAYVWLFESMLTTLGKIDDRLLDDYVFVKMVTTGARGARYVALSPERLFPNDLKRASNPANFYQMQNGWFLNMIVNNKQKDERLYALATFMPENSKSDWSWTGVSEEGPTLDEIFASIGNP